MKKIFLFLTIAAAVLCACEKNNEIPTIKGEADFTYTINARTVTCTNASSDGFRARTWTIDTVTYTHTLKEISNQEKITYTFDRDGVYVISLEANDGSVSYFCDKEITIKTSTPDVPDTTATTTTETYLTAFVFNEIPKDNWYYKIVFSYESIMGTTQTINTAIKQIKQSALPYTYTLSEPILIGDTPNPFDNYSIFSLTVKYAANQYASGTLHTFDIYPSVLASMPGTTYTMAAADKDVSVSLIFEKR